MVMREATAIRQDIRPLRFGLLNLMPDKISTETQIARLLGSTPLQVELTLVKLVDHVSRHTAPDHMEAFYRPWSDVSNEKFDGFLITGAPVEKLPFDEVTYWEELSAILDWTQTHVFSTLAICWAAQAALHHFHGVDKRTLPEKAFGLFRHRNLNPTSPYLRGFSDDVSVPVSRWTEVLAEDITGIDGLEVLLDSREAGLCLVADAPKHTLYMFNHFEYDTDTLGTEYFRDRAKGMDIAPPRNYFPGDDPSQPPENRWRGHAHLFFANWINEVYQGTPFDLEAIGK